MEKNRRKQGTTYMDANYSWQQLAAHVEAALYCDAQNRLGLFDLDAESSAHQQIGLLPAAAAAAAALLAVRWRGHSSTVGRGAAAFLRAGRGSILMHKVARLSFHLDSTATTTVAAVVGREEKG